MATFCLIHGNWHDGSCWQALIDSLEARGHDAIAPDLPFDESGLGYALRAQPAMEAIAGIDGPVVVVGHSVSSAEAALVASEHPEALLVHLCPRMGPFAPIDAPPAFRPGFPFPPSRPDGTVVWDEDAAIDAMYPRLTPERGRALAKGLRAGAAPVGDYPLAGHPANRSVLVYTTHDEFFEPEFERFMALKLGAESIELPGGHFPMDEDPEGLAMLLDRLAREHVHPDAVAQRLTPARSICAAVLDIVRDPHPFRRQVLETTLSHVRSGVAVGEVGADWNDDQKTRGRSSGRPSRRPSPSRRGRSRGPGSRGRSSRRP